MALKLGVPNVVTMSGTPGSDPDMAVNIEHEDASYSRLDGLALAAQNRRAAAAKM